VKKYVFKALNMFEFNYIAFRTIAVIIQNVLRIVYFTPSENIFKNIFSYVIITNSMM